MTNVKAPPRARREIVDERRSRNRLRRELCAEQRVIAASPAIVAEQPEARGDDELAERGCSGCSISPTSARRAAGRTRSRRNRSRCRPDAPQKCAERGRKNCRAPENAIARVVAKTPPLTHRFHRARPVSRRALQRKVGISPRRKSEFFIEQRSAVSVAVSSVNKVRPRARARRSPRASARSRRRGAMGDA